MALCQGVVPTQGVIMSLVCRVVSTFCLSLASPWAGISSEVFKREESCLSFSQWLLTAEM